MGKGIAKAAFFVGGAHGVFVPQRLPFFGKMRE